MKIAFILFLTLISISSYIEPIGAQPLVTSNPPLEYCLQDTKRHIFNGNIGNIYTGGISQEKLSDFYTAFSKDICGFYPGGGIEAYITVGKILPVYLPTKDVPIGVYAVYLGQDYTKYGQDAFYSGAYYMASYKNNSHTWRSRMPPGFYGGKYHISGKSNNDAYLTSLAEPFVSAPMLQMYNYLGHPLLVARSSTGVVIDVYFQNRPNIANPMERAKKFLGSKWYTP